MAMKHIVWICFFFLFVGTANAITWVSVEKTDPITGDKVTVQKPGSFGTYIYSWPSKFDLVFWPLTDENWIWFCPKSGYASFGGDFDKLSDREKEHLSKWLKENYDPSRKPETHESKLAWLERVYGQRERDEQFWGHFYRLMVYTYRDDEQKSLEYVKKAMPLLQKALDAKPRGIRRIEVLYLLGEYSRRTGQDEKAREYFRQVKAEKYEDGDGKEKVGHPYFLELVQDREKLMKKESSNKPDAGDGN